MTTHSIYDNEEFFDTVSSFKEDVRDGIFLEFFGSYHICHVFSLSALSTMSSSTRQLLCKDITQRQEPDYEYVTIIL